jgi:hypothetical protein
LELVNQQPACKRWNLEGWRVEIWSGRRGSNPQLSAWESNLSVLYFQYLQNRSARTYAHALHIAHPLPDLRIAAGRLRDGFYHALLFATADLRLLFCARSKPIFEVRGAD